MVPKIKIKIQKRIEELLKVKHLDFKNDKNCSEYDIGYCVRRYYKNNIPYHYTFIYNDIHYKVNLFISTYHIETYQTVSDIEYFYRICEFINKEINELIDNILKNVELLDEETKNYFKYKIKY